MQTKEITAPDRITLVVQQPKSIKNHVWITARREKMFVREMETSHIRNCIRCFNGQGNMRIPSNYLGGKEKWLKIFKEELINRQ